MSHKGITVTGHQHGDCFANFFIEKINGIKNVTKLYDNIYNGNRKIEANYSTFMSRANFFEKYE